MYKLQLNNKTLNFTKLLICIYWLFQNLTSVGKLKHVYSHRCKHVYFTNKGCDSSSQKDFESHKNRTRAFLYLGYIIH